jgi:2-polyprenyl-6-hydroxyphenyl methylase/3-demethylubiquinone-9 3-methyltransferase
MHAFLHSFIRLNKKLCGLVEPTLPHTRTYLPDVYAKLVGDEMNSRLRPTVVDVGGGKACRFAGYRDEASDAKIIAVDISAEELSHNHDVDERIVADVVQGLPFEDESVDMVVSRSVLEHLTDTETFISEAARVLKPDGSFIHLFPSKLAPHAVINRLLPNRATRRLLSLFMPGSEGRLGFPAFYDNCLASDIKPILLKNRLHIVDMRASYYSADYFDFFAPLYLLVVGYEFIAHALQIEDLAASILIVASKGE